MEGIYPVIGMVPQTAVVPVRAQLIYLNMLLYI